MPMPHASPGPPLVRPLTFGLFLAGGLALAVSCGGQLTEDTSSLPPGAAGSGGAARPDGGQAAGSGGTEPSDAGPDGPKKPPSKDAGGDAAKDSGKDAKDALPDYVDPGCPDAGPPIMQYQCDPYSTGICPDDMTCYPFVEYPSEPCGQEIYGAQCVFAGTGGQGEPCDGGCKAGHVCVISGQGTQCILMCDLKDPNPCLDGLICVPVDIPGLGGCI